MVLGVGVEQFGDRAVLEYGADGAGQQRGDRQDGQAIPALFLGNRHGVGQHDLARTAVLESLDGRAGEHAMRGDHGHRLGSRVLQHVACARDGTGGVDQVIDKHAVLAGDVAGKDCVLVDDLIDTAGTIAGACHVLQDAGAKSVTVVATHGVLSGPAIERLKNCGAREVVLTDTVPIPEEKRWDGLTVLSIAPLLASAIRAVFEDGSVAELFDTYPEHHGQGFLFA